MLKIIATYSFLFFSCFLIAQEPYVKLEVSPTTVEKGMPVSVVIKTNVEGDLYFDVPDGFVKSGATHSGMSSSISYINGKSIVEKQKYQQFTGYFETEGSFRLGPVKMKTINGDILSEPVTVEVVKATNMISEDPQKNMDKPIFGIIEQSKRSVYLGEPFVLEAKVYAQIDIIQVENYEPFQVTGAAETHLIQDQRQVTRNQEKVGGKHVLTFKLGKTTVFPEQVGTFSISPFQMILFYDDPRRLFPERTRLRSNESKIEVLPLPDNAPESFTGGVGKFELSSTLSNQKINQGKVVELTVQIKGVGNLHRIEAPKLVLPSGLVLYGDPEENDDINFTARGAKGIKSFTFYIQTNEAGNIEFPAIQMSYFNPVTEKYETVSSQPHQLNVIEDENFTPLIVESVVDNVEEVVVKLQPVITENDDVSSPKQHFFTTTGISLLASPFLAGLFFIFINNYKQRNEVEQLSKRKSKEAHKKATQLLDSINTRELNAVQYVDELQNIFSQYLVEKWGVSDNIIDRALFEQYMRNGKVTPNTYKEILGYLNILDQSRYGNVESSLDVVELKTSLMSIIDKIEVGT